MPDESQLSILHVISDRDRRGAQVFAMQLAHELDRQATRNRVVALAPGRYDDLIPVAALGPRARSPRTLRALRRAADDADVVVAHGSSTLLACAVALLGSGTPFVYRQISDPLHWAATWSRRLRVALLLRRAATIVALSSSVAQVMQRHYRLRADHITIIPNAVPTREFQPPSPEAREMARQQFGLTSAAFVAAYIGALDANKGVAMLLEALTDLDMVELLVVGAGSDRATLEAQSVRCGGRVHFVGALPDTRPALHAADVVVLLSKTESMPAVLIEAGLCGLPVVATDVGAIREVVVHDQTGVLLPVDDARRTATTLRELALDRSRSREMGRAAALRCRDRFSIEAISSQWRETVTRVRPSDR